MRSIVRAAVFFGVVSLTVAFAPNVQSRNNFETKFQATNMGEEIDTRSFMLRREEVAPILSFGEGGKEKLVNAHGLWCLVVSLITGPIWMLAMKLVHTMNEKDENRALYDKTGKIWSKAWLTATDSYPTVSGNLERLKAGNDAGACLFVANHASWLDIPVLCTVLDPVFKFIAKGELSKVPCIGTQLSGVRFDLIFIIVMKSLSDSHKSLQSLLQGDHILIDRDDRKSQLKTFKEGIKWLKKGVPIMAFPEGQRSKDGHLMDFKGGLFLMAAKTKVPIVPITLSHTHAVMPSNALFPFQTGRGKLHVHVHDQIDTEGKTEEELSALVRSSFMSKLPLEQQPIEPILSAEELDSLVDEKQKPSSTPERISVE